MKCSDETESHISKKSEKKKFKMELNELFKLQHIKILISPFVLYH